MSQNDTGLSLAFSIRLKTLLFALFFFAYIPAFVLTLSYILQQRNHAIAEIESKTESTLQSVNTKVNKIIGDVERMLILFANTTVVKSGSSEECSKFMKDVLQDLPQYINFGVADENGNLICSGLPLEKQFNLSNRSYFLDAKELGTLAMGEYRLNLITQDPSINFGYPITNEDETIKKVVFASVDISWLNKEIESMTGVDSGNTAITLLDKSGTILARQPAPQPWIGANVASKPLGKIVTKGIQGEAEFEGLDGVQRYYKYLPISLNTGNVGGYLATGASAQEALFQIDKTLFPILFFILITGLGTLFIGLKLDKLGLAQD